MIPLSSSAQIVQVTGLQRNLQLTASAQVGFVSDRSCEGSISGVKRQLLDSSMKGVAFLQSELLLNESFWKKWVWKKNLKLVEAVSYPEVQIFCSILFLN